MRMCIKDGTIKDGRGLKGLINILGNNNLQILMGITLILMHTNLMDMVTLIVIANNHHPMPMNHLPNIVLNHRTHKPYTTKHLHMILTHIHYTNHLVNHMKHMKNHPNSTPNTLKNYHLHVITKMRHLQCMRTLNHKMNHLPHLKKSWLILLTLPLSWNHWTHATSKASLRMNMRNQPKKGA